MGVLCLAARGGQGGQAEAGDQAEPAEPADKAGVDAGHDEGRRTGLDYRRAPCPAPVGPAILSAEPLDSPVPLAQDGLDALAGFTNWDAAGHAQSQFQLSGLHCAACAFTIQDALARVPGVRAARVNAASARLVLDWDPAQASLADVATAVERAGYRAAARCGRQQPGAAPCRAAPDAVARVREQLRGHAGHDAGGAGLRGRAG